MPSFIRTRRQVFPTMNQPDTTFYVIGGTLRADAACYVERQADRDLLDSLLRGDCCYVLTSRQMGKSSLMVRTAQKLRSQGVQVVVLDLTAIGQNLTPEQWYDGLMVRMGRQLDLEDALEDYWNQQERLSPVQRFFSAIHDIVLPQLQGALVVFVDEIDVVRSLPFSTDEFFAAIRECFTRRTVDPEFNRVAFCLMGVATPSDLIKNVRMTPFNIARRIELRDFTETEAQPLAHALGRSEFRARRLLRRVLYWTGGHPYLTQRLCQAIAADKSVRWARHVDRVCREIFLSHRARERDDNLLFVRERLLKSETDRVKLLRLYRKVHLTTHITGIFRLRTGLEKIAPVADEETNPLVSVLRLSGITREEKGFLKIRNRIYYQAFDRHWVTAHMPEVELWRVLVMFFTHVQRLAVFVIRLFVALVIISLVFTSVFSVFRDHFFPPSERGPGPPGRSRSGGGPLRGGLSRLAANTQHPSPVVPPRDPTTPAHLINLSDFYTASLTNNWHVGMGGSLADVPTGIQKFKGLDFEVRGIVQLASRELDDQGYPRKVEGIPVNQKCSRLHFLHATGWSDTPGRQIANFVIHYVDGRRRFVPVIYGQDAFDWVPNDFDGTALSGVEVAWEGPARDGSTGSKTRRLFLLTWTNPLPKAEIKSIDFESAMNLAAPFLIAITAEP